MTSMFWGLKMEPGKRYSTTVDKSFHISMATLDSQSVNSENEVISVALEEKGGGVFYLTNLRKKDSLYSHMDLNFMTGDQITLFCKGQGTVHLSGYMVPDDDELSTTMLDDEAEEEEDEEIDEEEVDESITNILKGSMAGKKNAKAEGGVKRKQENEKSKKAKKKKIEMKKVEEDSDADSDEVDDDDLKALMGGNTTNDLDSDDEDEEGEAEDEEEDDDEDEDDDEEEEEEVKVPPPKKQKQKKNAKPQQTPQNTSTNKTPNGVVSPSQKQGKKEEPRKSIDGGKQNQQNQQQTKQAETSLTGGVKSKDIKVGHGAVCKPGKTAVVYYTGRLKSNGKVFDSVTQGSGFKFKVGQGEVIKGWDIGVAGMKVGGKRILTCPPQVAYGQKGSPPQIPPNSTLVFEVELRNVH